MFVCVCVIALRTCPTSLKKVPARGREQEITIKEASPRERSFQLPVVFAQLSCSGFGTGDYRFRPTSSRRDLNASEQTANLSLPKSFEVTKPLEPRQRRVQKSCDKGTECDTVSLKIERERFSGFSPFTLYFLI